MQRAVPEHASFLSQLCATQIRIYVVNLADGSSRFVTHGVAYDWHVPSI